MEELFIKLLSSVSFSYSKVKGDDIFVTNYQGVAHQIHYNRGIFYIYIGNEVKYFTDNFEDIINYFKNPQTVGI